MVFESSRLGKADWAGLRRRLGNTSLRDHLLSAGVVVSLTAAGFVLPGLTLKPGFQGYVSNASVKISNPRANTPDVERLADQFHETLLSPMSLGLMVSELKLEPRELVGTQAPGYVSVMLDLLAGGGQESGSLVGATETALKQSVSITSSAASSEIGIDVTAATPDVAQRITGYLASRIAGEIGTERHDPQLQAVEKARVALDSAEAALTGFQMRHGGEAVGHIQGLQQKIREDDATTATLVQRDNELEEAITSAASMKADDVLSRNLPILPEFAPLETIRQTYATAKLSLAEVSVDHGPKHPRMIAAQAAVDAARAAAMPALRRVREALAQERTRLQASLDAQASLRADLESQLKAMGDAPADLSRLEAALEKARGNYINSSQAAGTFSPAPKVSASVSKEAQPGTASYDSFTATGTAIAGSVAGLLIALFALSFKRREERQDEIDIVETVEPEMQTVVTVEEPVVSADVIEIEPGIFDDATLEKTDEPVAKELALADEIDGAFDDDEPLFDTAQDEPANDMPLDQRVRQVLMRNAVPAEEFAEKVQGEAPVFKLPPLLAAAMAGKAEHPQAESEDLHALRQELVVLRERLHQLAEERQARDRA